MYTMIEYQIGCMQKNIKHLILFTKYFYHKNFFLQDMADTEKPQRFVTGRAG